RAPGALPVAVGPREQDDWPVEALDETRRDDPDHALVPALARDDVRAPPPVVLGPLLDLLRRLAEDARLDRLSLAIQLLELVRKPAGLLGVVGQQELERRARMAEPARRV